MFFLFWSFFPLTSKQIGMSLHPVWLKTDSVMFLSCRTDKSGQLNGYLRTQASCGQQRLWSDWADAQADLSLRLAHSHIVSFVIRRLKSNWASSWENVSLGVSDQVRHKLACSATEASMRLEILVTETRDITLSRQRTIKALIRLSGCAGWSALLLFAYDIRHIFLWPGSIVYKVHHRYVINRCFKRIIEKLSWSGTKPTKWPVRPAKTRISLGICPV